MLLRNIILFSIIINLAKTIKFKFCICVTPFIIYFSLIVWLGGKLWKIVENYLKESPRVLSRLQRDA